MIFPLFSEYVESIRSAEDNLAELSYLSPVWDANGDPVMTGGNFAVVFKMQDKNTGKLYALKCFTKEQKGRAENYKLIAEELEFVNTTYFTHFKYYDKELFVDCANSDETEFPVVLMDWVEGITLDKYIRKHINDQYELSLLAYQFSRLAMWLMPQPFAHGDLKPDNILVQDDGTLVLVDYDGMYVPAMKGQKARELGSPDFRHPLRTEDDFDEHIDDFALTLIMLSIKVFQIDKTFLGKSGNEDNCLIFVDADFRDLANSSANQRLFSLMSKDDLSHFYSLFLMALSDKKVARDVLEVILTPIISMAEKEIRWLKAEKLCNEGNAPEDQLRNAYSIFSRLSKEQHIDAKVCLSCCMRNGYGCDKDIDKGIELLFLCAKLGNTRAQLSLGLCYEKGKGVSQSYEQAVEWYSKAVEKNDQRAQFALGLCYEYGRGVPKSYEHAVKWYRKAAEQGYASAQCNLGRFYKYGYGVTQSYKQAFEWYNKAAKQDNQTAQYVLGLCYEQGLGVAQNDEQALEWYNKAANQGNIPSKSRIKILTASISTKVTEEDLTNAWKDEYGATYSADKKRLFKLPSNQKVYIIREGTKIVCDIAFWGRFDLRFVSFPDSIEKVSKLAFFGHLEYFNLECISIPKGKKDKFSELIPSLKDKLVERRLGWYINGMRHFNADEIAAVNRVEVADSKFGKSAHFFINSGEETHIPLSQYSTLSVGDLIDLKTAKLITLSREGDNDIYRVIE